MAPAVVQARPSPATLRRTLTWRQGAGFTIAAVLGTGVLVLPAVTADMAGPAALVAWAAMAVCAVPMALTLGRLAARIPDAGGIAAYAQAAFGSQVGRTVGLLYLGTVPVAGPAAALIGAGYLTAFLGLGHGPAVAIAAGMLAIALVLNALGVELSGGAATAIVTAIAALLMAAVVAAAPHARAALLRPFAPLGWVAVGQAFALLYWAFVGWEMLGHMAEEFVAPGRDIPRALAASLAVVDVLYLAVALTTVATGTYRGGATDDGLARLVSLGLGAAGAAVTAALAALVTYGTIHTYVAGFSRLIYAQAREGNLPAALGYIDPRLRTPLRVFGAMAVAFAIVVAWDAWAPFSLAALIAWPSAIFIALYVTAMAAGWRLLNGRGERALAAIGAIVSAVALPFAGWAVALPAGIVAASLVRERWPRRAARRANRQVAGGG